MPKVRETGDLLTEKINPNTIDIDSKTTDQIVDTIISEDKLISSAITAQNANISLAVDLICDSLKGGGRLFFTGAGTSGRLGVIEAAECPPTFGTDPEMIQAIIAGGSEAITRSIEGAEDSTEDSVIELKKRGLTASDIVVGIAASSSTPFVQSSMEYSKKTGAKTVLITCNPAINTLPDITISLLTGPEVIVGSTRLKAGTATKMVLNILTTASMIRLGKTYGNLMVDVQPKSSKLRDRAIRIVIELCGIDSDKARETLEISNWNVKASVVMIKKNMDLDDALKLLEESDGFLKKALL